MKLAWPALLRSRLGPPGSPSLALRPPTGYGDHLMLTAVMEGIAAAHPGVRFRIAASHPELFDENPLVEELADEGRLKKYRPALLEEYLPVRFRPPAERVGQLDGHLIDDMYRRVLEASGLTLTDRPRRPRIYLRPGEGRAIRERAAALPRPRIAAASFGKSSVRLPNKIYPADQWLGLSPRLAEMGSVLHLGSRREGPLLPGARDFRNLGYRATAAVLQECDLLVTHVGGLMHLAAAVGTPVVALYGAAEHPAISGYPWNRNLYTPIECGPCWMETPCDHHSCMRRLTPERVAREVEAALAELAAGRSLRGVEISG